AHLFLSTRELMHLSPVVEVPHEHTAIMCRRNQSLPSMIQTRSCQRGTMLSAEFKHRLARVNVPQMHTLIHTHRDDLLKYFGEANGNNKIGMCRSTSTCLVTGCNDHRP